MDVPENQSAFEGKLLIAMPGMSDPRFDRSVIFVCSHSEDGALGLIVNKPVVTMAFDEVLKRLGIGTSRRDIRVHFGGPVEPGRGFVLHSPEYEGDGGTIRVGDFSMTATLDIVEALARGEGPGSAIFALGYAGWGPGQLEAEMAANGWLLTDASRDLVFGQADAEKWSAALKAIGVDALSLSGTAGHA